MLENTINKFIKEFNKYMPEKIYVQFPDKKMGDGKLGVVLKDYKTAKRILMDPEMGFAEEYVNGNININGSLEKLLIGGLTYVNLMDKEKKQIDFTKFFFNFLGMLKKIEEKEVQYHYDLGNDFYKSWLDKSMTYSCAFFTKKDMSLEEAQEEKRNIIYEKLRLKNAKNFLDIGCGWGSVIINAAKKYNIPCVGITLSKNQYEYVKEKIKDENLNNLVEVYLMHYEDLPKLNKKFDRIVSIGMFEHVGKERYKKFFSVVNNILEKKGLFLLHTIGKQHPAPTSKWIRKYIFPGGHLPCVSEIFDSSKESDLYFMDMDDWRLHYYKTLIEWRKRFCNIKDTVIKKFDEKFYRMWNLYLISSAVSFYIGEQHLYQILYSNGVNNNYPIIKRTFIEESLI
ncbi:class I SAM-dependent methyltransferase [Lebetimonas sp. JH292]|uniref:class I SAM-dependent methyltransferase n=1 Tax=Lebetimonas sp. JH292 TaxID=990068 RepID=UPI00046788FE|nr:class I SAM-dependent methyltransferase [Lebetimonas sp. JH292]